MSIREIDPADADAQRIDGVMLAWQKRQGESFDADLRRRLGGISGPEQPEPVRTVDEPPVLEAVKPLAETEPMAALAPEPVLNLWEPTVRAPEPMVLAPEPPVSAPEEGLTGRLPVPTPHRASVRAGSARRGKPARRPSKQWRKASKPKRR